LYKWKFYGIINTLVTTNEAGRIRFQDQRSILTSFYALNDVDDVTKEAVLKHCIVNEVRISSSKVDPTNQVISRNSVNEIIKSIGIFTTKTAREVLPEDYQDDIIKEIVFPVIERELRLFRDLDSYVQLALAYQFQTIHYVAGDVVVKNLDTSPGLVYIKRGMMVAISPNPVEGGIVKLKEGDFFGELNMAFR
jgi:hypothetical protein